MVTGLLGAGPVPELRAATAARDAAMDVTDCKVVIVEGAASWGKVTGGVSRRELLVPVLPLSDTAGLCNHKIGITVGRKSLTDLPLGIRKNTYRGRLGERSPVTHTTLFQGLPVLNFGLDSQ
jgi:hypothetical protein